MLGVSIAEIMDTLIGVGEYRCASRRTRLSSDPWLGLFQGKFETNTRVRSLFETGDRFVKVPGPKGLGY